MTKYKSEHESGNLLDYNPTSNELAVTGKNGGGRYVTLSDRNKRELALELLAQQFDIVYLGTSTDGQIKLAPKRVKTEYGQFYRVRSTVDMMSPLQGNPLVRVTEVDEHGYFRVQTESGESYGWQGHRPNLVGPIKVEVTTVEKWTEVA